MTDSALIELRKASFGYHGVHVLENVDLSIEPGRVLGIIGPNGSGKTTLIRGALGLIEPSSGTVERADVDVGYVPQREDLDAAFPLTVEEVVHMGACNRLTRWGRLRPTERELARECLGRVGLVERARVPFASLSGGQRQRVLIARALMSRPRLLLLDEPTSGIDVTAQRVVSELLVRLRDEDQLAVLLVTHQLPVLRQIADAVVWVSGGAVVEGAPEEMLRPDRLDELFTTTRVET